MRLFCALDLPGSTIRLIEDWQREEAEGHPQWRPVPARSLHMTLAFLGERPAADVPRIAAIIAALESAGDGTEPVIGTLEPDPIAVAARKPRLLAFGVAGESIPALQATLGRELGAAGLYEPEQRPFWPHVTVLRRRSGSGGSRIGSLPIPHSDAGTGGRGGHAFGAVRVALYRSEIRPGGSEYTCLAARDLPSTGG